MAGENTNIYIQQGGSVQVVTSAGKINIQDDGTLTFGDSDDVTMKWNGTVFLLTGLPTSNPSVANALWVNSNVLTLSTG